MDLYFDLDGTLTDSSDGIIRCFAHAVEKMGVELADLPLRSCVGPPLPAAFRTLLGSSEPSLIERAIALYRERFEAAGMFENALYPGVVEALSELRREHIACGS